MTDNDSAIIAITSGQRRLTFSWLRYDGDDCFRSHTVEYRDPDKRLLHDYKECAIRSVRILTEMLDANAGEKGFGFRVPQIVYYDVKICGGTFYYHAFSDELPLEFSIELDNFTATNKQDFRSYWNNR
jgi:hypothetical protein